MGGGRGYGPTHSQSLEKLFLGVDGLTIVAQNIFSNAGELLKQSVDLGSPVLFIENKINYSQINEFSAVPEYATITKTNEIFPLYEYSIKDENNYDYIIITYGGMVKISYDVINSLYENEQIIGKLIAPTNISDFQYLNKKDIVKDGDNLITLEEGNKTSGFGSEVIANMSLVGNFNYLRISKGEGIISNSRYLEDKILPTSDSVYNKIVYFLEQL
jgi:pyruvate/2-oxoglutarate/acetoin dehydrogenase E1 component